MVVTNFGRSGNTLLWCGSAEVPRYAAIGDGSGADVATLGSLINESGTARTDFTDRDISTNQEIAYTFDYNSVAMSGIDLTEFGIGGSQAPGTNGNQLVLGSSGLSAYSNVLSGGNF